MMLSYEEYLNLRRTLRNISDFRKFPYPRGTLLGILQQKKVEYVKKSYNKFYSRLEKIVEYWKVNKNLPKWLTLPPVMRVRLLLKGLGYSTKTINKALRNPYELDDDKLREIILSAVKRDYIYSPIAVKLQFSRGKLGESIIDETLKKLGIEFKREHELRKIFSKTPDFYFEEPIEMLGKKIKWIESKAMFGDLKVHQTYSRKQYFKYWEMFGDGLVIYWLGCIKGIPADDGCWIRSRLKDALLEMKVYFNGDESLAEKIGGVFVEVDEDSLRAAEKIVDAFSRGFVVTSCDSAEVKKILENMGLEVIDLH